MIFMSSFNLSKILIWAILWIENHKMSIKKRMYMKILGKITKQEMKMIWIDNKIYLKIKIKKEIKIILRIISLV